MVMTSSYIPIWLVLIVIGIFIGILLRKKWNKSYIYLIFFSVFYIYILFVFSYTQFPIYIVTPNELVMSYGDMFKYNIYFIPSFSELMSPAGLWNIVMTIPFGFGLGFLLKTNMKRIIAYGLLFSVALETMQFLNMIITRFSLRTVDINDVINNTIGTVIGYLLFICFIFVVKKAVDKFSIKHNMLINYIFQCAENHR